MKLYQIECENTRFGSKQEIVAGFVEHDVFKDVYYNLYLDEVCRNNKRRMSFNSFIKKMKSNKILKPFKDFTLSYSVVMLDMNRG